MDGNWFNAGDFAVSHKINDLPKLGAAPKTPVSPCGTIAALFAALIAALIAALLTPPENGEKW